MNWLRENWLKIVAILFLLGAIGHIQYYAYYQLMNWVVVGAAIVTSVQAYKQNRTWIAWLFVLLAVVFNPVAPLYFSADVWRIADLVAATIFAISFAFVRSTK